MPLIRVPRLILLLVLPLVAGLMVLLDPAPSTAVAPTGTIVYVKHHDVYVARPDGSGERRVTFDGTAAKPWRTPSSSDAGMIVAARGPLIHRMDQWGTVLTSIDPPDLVDSAGEAIGGPVVHAVVSPDGSRIAYTYEHETCPLRLPCRMRWSTSITAATGPTPSSTFGVTLHENPSWITGSRLLLNGLGYDAVYVFDLAKGDRFWFHDAQPTTDFHPLFEPVVSRDGAMFAAVRGEGPQAHVITAAVNGEIRTGPVPTWPTYRCATSAGGLSSPSFAPDGSALAWAEPDGVWVKRDPLACSVQPALVVPGATSPHWSAASLQSTRPTYPPKPRSAFALGARPDVKLKGRARPGRVVRASAGSWSPAPTAVRYQWLRDGKPIRGATRATYKLKRADRSHRITVRVRVHHPSCLDAVALSRAVKVRR